MKSESESESLPSGLGAAVSRESESESTPEFPVVVAQVNHLGRRMYFLAHSIPCEPPCCRNGVARWPRRARCRLCDAARGRAVTAQAAGTSGTRL